MNRFSSFARPFAAAFSLAFVLAPVTASAETRTAPSAAAAKDRAQNRRPAKDVRQGRPTPEQGRLAEERPQFPMDAARFQTMTAERTQEARERLAAHLAERGAPEALRTERLAQFDERAAAVRASLRAASADGTITRAEAKQIRDLARDAQKGPRDGHKAGAAEKKDHPSREARGERAGERPAPANVPRAERPAGPRAQR